MKILVTGGCGFVGAAVVRRALAEGFAVVNVDAITHAGDPDNIGDALTSPRYAFEYADICDAEAMAAIFARHKPDAVLHLAAESRVDPAAGGALAFLRTNVMGTATLLEAARAHLARLPESRRAGFRFHHVSTDAVFGSLGEEGQFDEASPYAPNAPFSASKASSDMLVRAWGKAYGLAVVITTTSSAYGPFQHPENLIPMVIANGLEGRPIPLHGRGAQVRDWLYVEDQAAALLRVLVHGQTGETYCIGGQAEHSSFDIVRIVCAALDRARPRAWPHADLIRFVSERPGQDFRRAVSNAKIETDLGWSPSVDLATGIARTVRWYLDHEAWWTALRERGYAGARLGLERA